VQDELVANDEKVVLRVEDLIRWVVEGADWNWGTLAVCEKDVKSPVLKQSQLSEVFAVNNSSLQYRDLQKEKKVSGI